MKGQLGSKLVNTSSRKWINQNRRPYLDACSALITEARKENYISARVVRDGNNAKAGVVVVVTNRADENHRRVGWSALHPRDKFDGRIGIKKAIESSLPIPFGSSLETIMDIVSTLPTKSAVKQETQLPLWMENDVYEIIAKYWRKYPWKGGAV